MSPNWHYGGLSDYYKPGLGSLVSMLTLSAVSTLKYLLQLMFLNNEGYKPRKMLENPTKKRKQQALKNV